MRVCVEGMTGRLIEAQSGNGDDLDVLVANALAAGFASEDVRAMVVSDEDFQNLVAAHAAEDVKWTPLEFLSRFTADETGAMASAATTDPEVFLLWQMTMGAREIVRDDQRTIAGLDLLVTKGLLTAERRAEILG